MLAAEKHKGTFLAPIGIGLALFIAELAGKHPPSRQPTTHDPAGVYYTGGSLNPARTFGADVANAKFSHYEWIYWLGPALGSVLAVIFYRLIKYFEYETANPGQDFDEQEHELFNPSENPASRSEVRRPNAAAEYALGQPGSPVEPRQSTSQGAVAPGVAEKVRGNEVV